MIDSRFYDIAPPKSLKEISDYIGGVCFGDDVQISSVAALSDAMGGNLSYCEKWNDDGFIDTDASAIIIQETLKNKVPNGCATIIVASPRFSFSKFVTSFVKEKVTYIDCRKNALIENNAIIGNGAIIGENVEIGENTIIGPNAIISDGVTIGRNSYISAGAFLQACHIGDNVRIGANTVIGKAGFGVVGGAAGIIDVPQLGRVIIQDNVTIGALCTIDRGAFGDTIIGMMSKIDNLCHIAHNVKIGKGVIMAAFAGISGSVTIDDYVMMGGRVGIGDHFNIGKGAKLAAGSAVLSDVPEGATFAGYPAKTKSKFLRETIALSRLANKGNNSK